MAQVIGGYDGAVHLVAGQWVWAGYFHDMRSGLQHLFRYTSAQKPPLGSLWEGEVRGVHERIDIRFFRAPEEEEVKSVWRAIGRGSNVFGVLSIAGFLRGNTLFCEKRLLLRHCARGADERRALGQRVYSAPLRIARAGSAVFKAR